MEKVEKCDTCTLFCSFRSMVAVATAQTSGGDPESYAYGDALSGHDTYLKLCWSSPKTLERKDLSLCPFCQWVVSSLNHFYGTDQRYSMGFFCFIGS